MKSIGGYFELELDAKGLYHNEALKLNTARHALQLLLQNISCSNIYLPFYTCEVVVETVNRLNIPFSFYYINLDLEPDFDFSIIKKDEYFLYINYFGLKDDFIDNLSKRCPRLIVDNSQSFYSMPLSNVSTFYTARKFFGVPDGAYLYANIPIAEYNKLPLGKSFERFDFLVKRVDLSAEEGYSDFQSAENTINDLPIEKMSKLTDRMLRSINYNIIAKKRCQNFSYLANALDKENMYNVKWNGRQIPMVYPFLTQRSDLKSKLNANRIYTASYWPSVLDHVNKQSTEFFITSNFVFLPIDQRYSKEDMDSIIKILT